MAYFLLIILALHVKEGISFLPTCEVSTEVVGCSRKLGGTVFETLLVNDRDGSSGHLLDWFNYYDSLRSLSCRCAKVARKQGYNTIGIQFFGECWGTKSIVKDLAPLLSLGDNSCINFYFQTCGSGDKFCTGTGCSTFVYTVAPIIPVHGNYSEWTDWTYCSKSCQGGVQQRFRFCNNPAPKDGGESCERLGEPEQERDCNNIACPDFDQSGCTAVAQSEHIDTVNASGQFLYGSSDRFCRVLKKEAGVRNNSYILKVSFFNYVSPSGTKHGRPGVIFNAKDLLNFQYFYLKLNFLNCYLTAVMQEGKIDYHKPYYKISKCPGNVLQSNTWIDILVRVEGGKVYVFANNKHLFTAPSLDPPIARGGYFVRNGDNYIVHYKNFGIK